MTKPELKQFSDLRPADFGNSSVWASCHSFDYDEPWFDETDEETFRPWTGKLPVNPSQGMFLVSARFELPDGRHFGGFVTPAVPGGGSVLGTQQPYLAVGERFYGFWGGIIGVDEPKKRSFYAAVAASEETAFPIKFATEPKLAEGEISGQIDGFYRMPGFNKKALVEK